jgi:hypothetical protein
MRKLILLALILMCPSLMFGLFHLAEQVANDAKLDAADRILIPVEILLALSIGSMGWYLWKTRKR